MEELFPIKLVAVHLHLRLQLIVEHTKEADALGDTKRPCCQALVEQLDVQKLLLKLRESASVDDATSDFLPVRQLRVLEGTRLGPVRDDVRRGHAELELWIDGRGPLLEAVLKV